MKQLLTTLGIIGTFFFFVPLAFANSSGPTICNSTGTGYTGNNLSNPSGLCSSTSGSVASAGGSNNADSATYFPDMNIPSNATITGIQLDVYAESPNGSTLRPGYTTNKGTTWAGQALGVASLSGSYTDITFGGPNNLFNATSTLDVISIYNNGNFGFSIDFANGAGPQGSAYNTRLTVYYTAPASTPSAFQQIFGWW